MRPAMGRVIGPAWLHDASDSEDETDKEKGSGMEDKTDKEKESDMEDETDKEKGSDMEDETDKENGSDIQDETDKEKGSDVEDETDKEKGGDRSIHEKGTGREKGSISDLFEEGSDSSIHEKGSCREKGSIFSDLFEEGSDRSINVKGTGRQKWSISDPFEKKKDLEDYGMFRRPIGDSARMMNLFEADKTTFQKMLKEEPIDVIERSISRLVLKNLNGTVHLRSDIQRLGLKSWDQQFDGERVFLLFHVTAEKVDLVFFHVEAMLCLFGIGLPNSEVSITPNEEIVIDDVGEEQWKTSWETPCNDKSRPMLLTLSKSGVDVSCGAKESSSDTGGAKGLSSPSDTIEATRSASQSYTGKATGPFSHSSAGGERGSSSRSHTGGATGPLSHSSTGGEKGSSSRSHAGGSTGPLAQSNTDGGKGSSSASATGGENESGGHMKHKPEHFESASPHTVGKLKNNLDSSGQEKRLVIEVLTRRCSTFKLDSSRSRRMGITLDEEEQAKKSYMKAKVVVEFLWNEEEYSDLDEGLVNPEENNQVLAGEIWEQEGGPRTLDVRSIVEYQMDISSVDFPERYHDHLFLSFGCMNEEAVLMDPEYSRLFSEIQFNETEFFENSETSTTNTAGKSHTGSNTVQAGWRAAVVVLNDAQYRREQVSGSTEGSKESIQTQRTNPVQCLSKAMAYAISSKCFRNTMKYEASLRQSALPKSKKNGIPEVCKEAAHQGMFSTVTIEAGARWILLEDHQRNRIEDHVFQCRKKLIRCNSKEEDDKSCEELYQEIITTLKVNHSFSYKTFHALKKVRSYNWWFKNDRKRVASIIA